MGSRIPIVIKSEVTGIATFRGVLNHLERLAQCDEGLFGEVLPQGYLSQPGREDVRIL